MVVKNKLVARQFLLIFCLCVILVVGFSTLSLTEVSVSKKDFTIKLSTIAELEWNKLPGMDVVEVHPPKGGSFFELPGPKSIPVRPYLEPFINSNGVAARLLQGDGQVMPVAILAKETPSIVELPEPPLALSMRQDGSIWVLNREELVHSSISGETIHTLSLSGMTLVSGKGDSVWVVGLDSTWFVTGDGSISGPYPWQGGFGSVSYGDSICALEKKKPRKVTCLSSSGQEQLSTLSFIPQLFEQFLAFNQNIAVTKTSSQLRIYAPNGVTANLVVQAAGLTKDGDAFISGSQDGKVALLTNKGKKFLPLPSISLETQGAYPIVAVVDERSLVYGLDQGIWYVGEEVESIFDVSEEKYRQDIFPYQWKLGGNNFAAANSDGIVVLSASGSTGLVLISLQWEL